ncbi:MAG: AmmeMemoRadiSam system protein B [Planctomycetota bacterium]
MNTRKPAVAGQFYPEQHESCEAQLDSFIDQMPPMDELPENIVAGLVPHAGWTFSGQLAAMTFYAIQQSREKVHTFIIFGAVHTFVSAPIAVYNKGSWITPTGSVAIDEELADRIIQKNSAAQADAHAHSSEHSIEVQIPFIEYLFPGSRIVPIMVAPVHQAVRLGSDIGDIIAAEKSKTIICIGSTDLTHYGPRYGFTPAGSGPEGLKWATEVNDKEFIKLAVEMKPEELLQTAAKNGSACGPGTAAATVAAAAKLGKTRGFLLAHTNSNEIMRTKFSRPGQESVGYASIVF